MRADGVYRRYQRKDVLDYTGDIAENSRVLAGTVENISANGFKLSGVPDAFNGDKLNYQVLVSGCGRRFKLMAKPCWEKKNLGSVEIGFKVIDASWEWYEFVLDAFNAEQIDKTEVKN